ncbi:hypothetical protein GGQ85_000851 [Nitrobacter vulgaris]|nr:hypothetical protein [Nitrobacter vulgaris]
MAMYAGAGQATSLLAPVRTNGAILT